LYISNIHPLELTYTLKIDPWKRRFLLDTIIFRGYVSFREGILSNPQNPSKKNPNAPCINAKVTLKTLLDYMNTP